MSSPLKLFRIKLQNEDGIIQLATTQRLTFQEAARDAYLLASGSGINKSKILGIVQVEHDIEATNYQVNYNSYISSVLPKPSIKNAS